MIEKLVGFMVEEFIGNSNYKIDSTENEKGDINLTLSVETEDMGKVIGKQGRIAKAMRTIIKSASAKENKHYFLEIVENK